MLGFQKPSQARRRRCDSPLVKCWERSQSRAKAGGGVSSCKKQKTGPSSASKQRGPAQKKLILGGPSCPPLAPAGGGPPLLIDPSAAVPSAPPDLDFLSGMPDLAATGLPPVPPNLPGLPPPSLFFPDVPPGASIPPMDPPTSPNPTNPPSLDTPKKEHDVSPPRCNLEQPPLVPFFMGPPLVPAGSPGDVPPPGLHGLPPSVRGLELPIAAALSSAMARLSPVNIPKRPRRRRRPPTTPVGPNGTPSMTSKAVIRAAMTQRVRRLDVLNSVNEANLTPSQREEKKRLVHLENNRQTARLSRERKHLYVTSLEGRVATMAKHLAALELENAQLRALFESYAADLDPNTAAEVFGVHAAFVPPPVVKNDEDMADPSHGLASSLPPPPPFGPLCPPGGGPCEPGGGLKDMPSLTIPPPPMDPCPPGVPGCAIVEAEECTMIKREEDAEGVAPMPPPGGGLPPMPPLFGGWPMPPPGPLSVPPPS